MKRIPPTVRRTWSVTCRTTLAVALSLSTPPFACLCSSGPAREELAAKAAAGSGVRLTLVCAEAEGIGAPDGLTRVSERVLLMAPTAELNTAVQLPENSQVALAPMETYDAVEITLF
ncbi:hypothetical protein FBY33_1766 [Arthrobacter sp. SLBN-112]|jgi:hypothetical protein|uniref:hypothetical protein n=1 Tax=Arthrobacter sp. SLBN-112 TaxID=2768452 RepID=UPI00115090F3|nr:hypothetical protein [Arthrobacter sp. SLBN-112]TQJ39740.1 hypothetical protein FBY33_1766 [Arthrobacter sp. SLBN-112]